MITFEKGLYVRVQEMEGPRAPMPRPLQSGFVAETAYRVLGLHAPSETSDAYFVLSNDRDEVWFITTRHVRTAGLSKDGPFRIPLSGFTDPSTYPAFQVGSSALRSLTFRTPVRSGSGRSSIGPGVLRAWDSDSLFREQMR